MTDFYLNVPDAETFETLRGVAPFEYAEGGVTQSAGWDVDVIGEGQTYVDSWNSEGEPEYAVIPGFLINLRSGYQLPEELEQYQVFPDSPIRVWA